MNLVDFVNKYIKTNVDFDGVFGAQCVDLFRQYCKDVLNIEKHTGSVNGAKELFTKYDELSGQIYEKEVFIRLKFPDHYRFEPGDVAIWDSTSSNKYGHVAIVLEDKVNDLIVFEQDGFKQDGAKISYRSKKNLLGVLRRYNTWTFSL